MQHSPSYVPDNLRNILTAQPWTAEINGPPPTIAFSIPTQELAIRDTQFYAEEFCFSQEASEIVKSQSKNE